ncbi:MAG: DUF6036 family nucleotidyltransferase, partial [Gemmatimonadales bacterium]
RAVGDLLTHEGEHVAIVVTGGSALILQGLVDRTTADVDVLAVAQREQGRRAIRPPDPLPNPLARAIERVAQDLGLPPHWLNTVAGSQWQTGLPPGLQERLRWRVFGGLSVGLVSRYDLLKLKPRLHELEEAAAWVTAQDVSEAFQAAVGEVVAQVVRDVGRGD